MRQVSGKRGEREKGNMKHVMTVLSKGVVLHVARVTATPKLTSGGRVWTVQYSESHSEKAKLVFGAVSAGWSCKPKRPKFVDTCF